MGPAEGRKLESETMEGPLCPIFNSYLAGPCYLLQIKAGGAHHVRYDEPRLRNFYLRNRQTYPQDAFRRHSFGLIDSAHSCRLCHQFTCASPLFIRSQRITQCAARMVQGRPSTGPTYDQLADRSEAKSIRRARATSLRR